MQKPDPDDYELRDGYDLAQMTIVRSESSWDIGQGRFSFPAEMKQRRP